MAHRQIKKRVALLLGGEDFEAGLAALCEMPARQVVNPLFGLLYSGEPQLRWRAVTAMGRVVARQAEERMESARIIMRRFMWNLNDESGGMGWGSPEAMGEIMARHPGLASEYAAILVSYADPQGNFLEHPGLQLGVLWALGRLGRVHPELVRPAAAFLPDFLNSTESGLVGMALWAAAPLADDSLRTILSRKVSDTRAVVVYDQGRLNQTTIGRLALDGLNPNVA